MGVNTPDIVCDQELSRAGPSQGDHREGWVPDRTAIPTAEARKPPNQLVVTHLSIDGVPSHHIPDLPQVHHREGLVNEPKNPSDPFCPVPINVMTCPISPVPVGKTNAPVSGLPQTSQRLLQSAQWRMDNPSAGVFVQDIHTSCKPCCCCWHVHITYKSVNCKKKQLSNHGLTSHKGFDIVICLFPKTWARPCLTPAH